MTEFLICCAMYEKGRPFLMQWMQALAAATLDYDASVLIATDDLEDAENTLDPLRKYLPIQVVHAALGSTIADVRRILLQTARNSDAEILCFIDMDDLLIREALPRHRLALENADFSYGDLLLIDEVGLSTGQALFDGKGVPTQLTGVESILDRNFLGLSNTAVWRRAMPDAHGLNVPSEVVAVDWWLFTTLLLQHRVGKRSGEAVCQYRTYGGNLVGGVPGLGVNAILRRCEMVIKHYDQFRHDPRFMERAERVQLLRDRLLTNPERIAGVAASLPAGVWWEDITQLAAHVWQGCQDQTRLRM